MVEEISLPEKKDNYIFGDVFGKLMSKTSLKFQFQASMMSYAFIILSILGYAIYSIGWGDSAWYWKLFTGLNALCGFLILFSQLAGSFQQYQQFQMVSNVQELFGAIVPEVNQEIKDGV